MGTDLSLLKQGHTWHFCANKFKRGQTLFITTGTDLSSSRIFLNQGLSPFILSLFIPDFNYFPTFNFYPITAKKLIFQLKKKSNIIKIQLSYFRRQNMDGGSSYPIHFLENKKSLLNNLLISA